MIEFQSFRLVDTFVCTSLTKATLAELSFLPVSGARMGG